MTFHLHRRLLFAALASTLGASAWALEPATVELTDGLALTPTLKLGAGYDDNFRAAETREESSVVSTIAPTLAIGADNGKLKFDASYTANHEIYHSSRKDDNTDHILGARIELQPDARNRFNASAGYRKIEETAVADQKIENDRFNSSNVGGTYTYGAESATGQLRLGLNHDRLRYDNGLDPAGGGRLNADKERDSNAYVGAFLYRIAPKTKAVLEGRYTRLAAVHPLTAPRAGAPRPLSDPARARACRYRPWQAAAGPAPKSSARPGPAQKPVPRCGWLRRGRPATTARRAATAPGSVQARVEGGVA